MLATTFVGYGVAIVVDELDRFENGDRRVVVLLPQIHADYEGHTPPGNSGSQSVMRARTTSRSKSMSSAATNSQRYSWRNQRSPRVSRSSSRNCELMRG